MSVAWTYMPCQPFRSVEHATILITPGTDSMSNPCSEDHSARQLVKEELPAPDIHQPQPPTPRTYTSWKTESVELFSTMPWEPVHRTETRS